METLLAATVRIRTKHGLGLRGFESRELCPKLQDTARLSPKERCNPRPSRKRVAQRDCFQSATDFSERLLQRARAQSTKCSRRASTACSCSSAREGASDATKNRTQQRLKKARETARCLVKLPGRYDKDVDPGRSIARGPAVNKAGEATPVRELVNNRRTRRSATASRAATPARAEDVEHTCPEEIHPCTRGSLPATTL